ncbi:uncharacterized protein LOC135156024 [Lytechinus pictus]|uniref:uncharacterized protein LOC135156024 n=1 Tax=Lytechinus pictus TaxID=7653 RepID=UPI0030B9B017
MATSTMDAMTTLETTPLDEGTSGVGSLPNYMLIIVLAGGVSIAFLAVVLLMAIIGVFKTKRKSGTAKISNTGNNSGEPVSVQVELRTSPYPEPDKLEQNQDYLRPRSYREAEYTNTGDMTQVIPSDRMMAHVMYENIEFGDLGALYHNDPIGTLRH